MRNFDFDSGAMAPPGREWEIDKDVDEIAALHKVINNIKFWVVCDANGTCQGIFMTESLAQQVAKLCGAFVSDHVVQSVLPHELSCVTMNTVMDKDEYK